MQHHFIDCIFLCWFVWSHSVPPKDTRSVPNNILFWFYIIYFIPFFPYFFFSSSSSVNPSLARYSATPKTKIRKWASEIREPCPDPRREQANRCGHRAHDQASFFKLCSLSKLYNHVHLSVRGCQSYNPSSYQRWFIFLFDICCRNLAAEKATSLNENPLKKPKRITILVFVFCREWFNDPRFA